MLDGREIGWGRTYIRVHKHLFPFAIAKKRHAGGFVLLIIQIYISPHFNN